MESLIDRCIDFCSNERPHQDIDYVTPAERYDVVTLRSSKRAGAACRKRSNDGAWKPTEGSGETR